MKKNHEIAIRQLLTAWTRATREGPQDDVLNNHSDDALIYDVLPPMKYESPAAYRASWNEWQPDVQGNMLFELEDLNITASLEVAFAHGILQCGGTLPNGVSFRDTVRATFCLRNIEGSWKIFHQHISKPYDKS
jgi:ketosteroid isomerase-like protein